MTTEPTLIENFDSKSFC